METVSYFDLLPFGYGHYGPILTVILTFVLLVLSVVYVVRLHESVRKAIFGLSITCVLTSLWAGLSSGACSFTLLNAVVAGLMLLGAGISWALRFLCHETVQQK